MHNIKHYTVIIPHLLLRASKGYFFGAVFRVAFDRAQWRHMIKVIAIFCCLHPTDNRIMFTTSRPFVSTQTGALVTKGVVVSSWRQGYCMVGLLVGRFLRKTTTHAPVLITTVKFRSLLTYDCVILSDSEQFI